MGEGQKQDPEFSGSIGVTLVLYARICLIYWAGKIMAFKAENIMASCGLSGLARDTENRIQRLGEPKAGKSLMGIGSISAPNRWTGIQGRTLFPARTWETQPGNQCKGQLINQGNNTGAGSGGCSSGGLCGGRSWERRSMEEWRSGWAGAWKQGRQDADATWGWVQRENQPHTLLVGHQ